MQESVTALEIRLRVMIHTTAGWTGLEHKIWQTLCTQVEPSEILPTPFDNTPENHENTHSDFENIMNAHTAQACENIKNDGISIHAIAFDVPDTGNVRDLLDACAGSGRFLVGEGTPEERYADIISTGEFFHDVGNTELDDAFESIANQISALRLTR